MAEQGGFKSLSRLRDQNQSGKAFLGNNGFLSRGFFIPLKP